MGAIGGIGTIIQGVIAKKQSNQAAKELRRRGKIALADARRQGDRLKGEQRAAQGASGLVVDQGTPLDVLLDTAAELELDAQRAKFEFDAAAFEEKLRGRQVLFGAIGQGAASIVSTAATLGLAGSSGGGVNFSRNQQPTGFGGGQFQNRQVQGSRVNTLLGQLGTGRP